jgi:hypothetical protein
MEIGSQEREGMTRWSGGDIKGIWTAIKGISNNDARREEIPRIRRLNFGCGGAKLFVS